VARFNPIIRKAELAPFLFIGAQAVRGVPAAELVGQVGPERAKRLRELADDLCNELEPVIRALELPHLWVDPA
jgi:hypothetical protein